SATITGNTIGLALNGVSVLANGTPNGGRGDGVNVNSGASATIGGITAAARNVISGNRRDGVRCDLAGPGNGGGGNFIGTDKNGSAVLGNGGDGVHGIGGGTSDGETIAIIGEVAIIGETGVQIVGAPNVISGNSRNGVEIVSSSDYLIQGNTITGNGAA